MPYDNAVAESFFLSMKAEELSHHFYEEPEKLFQDVAEYVDFFNSKRIHQKLGYKTPDQIEEMYRDGELKQLNSETEDWKKESRPGVIPVGIPYIVKRNWTV